MGRMWNVCETYVRRMWNGLREYYGGVNNFMLMVNVKMRGV